MDQKMARLRDQRTEYLLYVKIATGLVAIPDLSVAILAG